MNQLTLQSATRSGTNNKTERKFYDFIIDGQSLLQQLSRLGLGYSDYISVLGCDSWIHPVRIHQKAIEELLGQRESEFPDNFIRLFICPECGDKYCGLIKIRIQRESNRIMWKDFYYDNFSESNSAIIIKDIGPFIFDAECYAMTLQSAIKPAKSWISRFLRKRH